MRIQRFTVEAFGRLRHLESGELPGLVAVLGPNEAGKSTLFHFLGSMLYGFYPASRDGNPYTPWGGGDPSGTMTLRLDGGACAHVERRLLSQPSGRLEFQDQGEDLRNRTLPWAEHVPRSVFHQVFAIRLQDMAGMDPETWATVQDRIVGAMGAADLRPARQVAAELEQEAGEIWRPTRRGNQRAREVAARARELRGARRDAAERDRLLRELVEEAERLRRSLQEAREARHGALLAVERIQQLLPVRTQLARVAALRREAGRPEELEGLPSDPAAALVDLDARIAALDARMEQVRAQRAEPRADMDALDGKRSVLLEQQDQVRAFIARRGVILADRERLTTLEQEVRDLQRRVEDAAGQVVQPPLSDEAAEILETLAVAEVRERVRAVRAAREDLQRVERGRRAAPPPPPAPSPLPHLALGAAGSALLAWSVAGGGAVPGAVGAVLLALALALAAHGRRKPEAPGSSETPDPALLNAALDEALAAVRSSVTGLPVHPSLVADPTDALVLGLQRVQELMRDLRDRQGTTAEIRARLEEADRDARSLCRVLDRGDGPGAVETAGVLEQELRAAERLAERAEAARKELARLQREEDETRREREASEAERGDLRARLAALGGGDADVGAALVRRRRQALDRASQLADEMERAHPDLGDLEARIRADEARGEAWTRDEGELARAKALVEELTQQVEATAARAEALERDVAHLRSGATVDTIDGEIDALEAAERDLLVDRDRRWVLARLLREADRRFREEHQPDVLRWAGEHLRGLTGGRYDRVMLAEGEGEGRFHLLGPSLQTPVALEPPVSTGTLEQAYLALRLAIIDHLDQGLERLPVFLDEVFVNWDRVRRREGMRLLGRLAERRQIFAFTCHPETAAELEDEGALVLRLPAS